MADHAIIANHLTKCFGSQCVLDDVSFSIPRGSVTAFLGRNGSGKTTTLRILLGLLEPTRGSSSVLGCNSQALTPEIRGRIGYLAESHPLINWMTVKQSGEYQSAFYPQWNQRIFDATVAHFSLKSKAKAGNLSRGERAGLALALVLATEPELLLLDDPTLGLDPVARRTLVEAIIYMTRSPDRTVLLSSHLLEDVEKVAQQVLILDKAVLRASCSTEDFFARITQYELTFSRVPPVLPRIPGLLNAVRTDRMCKVMVANPTKELETQLLQLQPDHMERTDVPFGDAVVAYMSENRSRSFFLSDIEDGST